MRNSPLRILVSALLAVPVALGLFMLMNALIDRDFEQPDVKARKIAEIVKPEETIETNVKEQKPEKVEDPEENRLSIIRKLFHKPEHFFFSKINFSKI